LSFISSHYDLSLQSNFNAMTRLTSGDIAPDFSTINQDGRSVDLKRYLKTKWLALYFYPHDMTETCTVQACNLNDGLKKLKRAGVKVVGVSEDPPSKHQKFILKYGLGFDLLADTNHSVHLAYGVWGPKKIMGREFDGTHRTTFIIDNSGVIRHVIHPVKAKVHADDIIHFVKNFESEAR
jgi:thioredoxin-dependent peroxiredoxin